MQRSAADGVEGAAQIISEFGTPIKVRRKFWLRDRRIVGIAPFRPALVVIAHPLGPHQFQGKCHHRRPASGLAVSDRWPVKDDAVRLEKSRQLFGSLETLALVEKPQA